MTSNIAQKQEWKHGLEWCRTENEASVLTRRANREQDRLGWDQFLRGRLTIMWGGIINNHLQRRKITNITTAQWGVTLLSINWKDIIAIWLQRNEEQQGATALEKSHQNKWKLIAKIKLLQWTNQRLPHRQWVLIIAQEDTLQDMMEDQLETYWYGAPPAQLLTDFWTLTDHVDIRQFFVCKDKIELDPGKLKQQAGKQIEVFAFWIQLSYILALSEKTI
jgi:hypothetical protein